MIIDFKKNNKRKTKILISPDLSELEVHVILTNSFEDDSIVGFQKNIDQEILDQIPFLKELKYYLELINKENEIPLTKIGNLPPRIVKDIYAQKIITDSFIETGTTKLSTENDVLSISLIKILADLAGITKKRNNKISLTKKGLNLMQNDELLFKLVFKTFIKKFNWGYLDVFNENDIVQNLFPYTIILLNDFGDLELDPVEYAEKLMDNFPYCLNAVEGLSYLSQEDIFKNTFVFRTFEMFLLLFNMIKYDKNEYKYKDPKTIKVTDVFYKTIKIDF